MRQGVLARKSTPASKLEAANAAPAGLRVSKPDDAFEQEAERAADRVMTPGAMTQGWSLSRMSIEPPLQRKCACGGSGECEECKGKEETLHRRAAGTATPSPSPPIVHDVLRSPGQPLDHHTRAFMERRFAHDFSQVRIHADAKAAESAGAVDALAYTVGQHIAFASGRYAPATQEGRRLMAHELAHTIQQAGLGDSLRRGSPQVLARLLLWRHPWLKPKTPSKRLASVGNTDETARGDGAHRKPTTCISNARLSRCSATSLKPS